MSKLNNSKVKKTGVLVMFVVIVLCACVFMNTPHVATLFNYEATTSDFAQAINERQTKEQALKTAIDGDFVLPSDYWTDGYYASEFDGGDGSFHKPYLISTPEQLALMAFYINNSILDTSYLHASFLLTNDIDMSGHYFAPMGRWENNRLFCGIFDGGGNTITGLLMKNRTDYSSGTIVGMFGVLGDQAVIINLVLDGALSFADPNIDVVDGMLVAVVAAMAEKNASVGFYNIQLYNSATFTPGVFKEYMPDEIKSGLFLAWQERDGSGGIYMDKAHARSSSVLINMYIDKSTWIIAPHTIVNSIGGLIGEANLVSIQDSSFDGVVGLEMVREDRNMDNWRYIFNAGGLIGALNTPEDQASFIKDVEVGAMIYLDTFGNTEFDRSTRYDSGGLPFSADVRQIGSIIGDANILGRGEVYIQDTEASAIVDAPNADEVVIDGGDPFLPPVEIPNSKANTQQSNIQNSQSNTQNVQSTSTESISQANLLGNHKNLQDAIYSGDYKSPEVLKLRGEISDYYKTHATIQKSSGIMPLGSGLQGPPETYPVYVPMSIAAPYLILGITYVLGLAALAIVAPFIVTVGLIIIVILIAIAIVIFAILFGIWGQARPKWESIVYVGGAIGSSGTDKFTFKNVHVANTAVTTDTMFSNEDWLATKIDSHHTTPTMAMILSQPESPRVDTLGQKVSLDINAKGTVMKGGTLGVDSILTYQWYYNTIDSNVILDGTENGFDGAKSVKVTGATQPSLDVTVDWVGSRYYFVSITNNVLQFRGTNPTVTARVGSKNISINPAVILEQPKDTSFNVGSLGNLSVSAEATGDLSYQWYFADFETTDPSRATLAMGADKSEYRPTHSVSGVYYYFVVVSVTLRQDNTDFIKDTISKIAKVTVTADANKPSIVQPAKFSTVAQYANTVIGTVVDLSNINGSLSYQWYKADTENGEGQILQGETHQSVVVDTDTPRDVWYYVVVSNTLKGSVQQVTSDRSKVTIKEAEKVNAKIDKIDNDGDIMVGESHNLYISATAEATIRYQWYRSLTSGNTDGVELEGGNKPYYNVQGNYAGTQYYYAVITTITPAGGVERAFSDVYELNIVDQNQLPLELETMKSKEDFIDDIRYTTIGILPIKRPGSTSYQWYGSNNTDGENAVPLKGENSNTLRVGNSEYHYFYVVVQNIVDIEVLDPDKNDGSTMIISHSNTATSDTIHVEPNIVLPPPPPTKPQPPAPDPDGSKFWVEVGITAGSIAALVVIALLILSAMKASTLKRQPQRASRDSRPLNKSGRKNLSNNTSRSVSNLNNKKPTNTRNQTNNKQRSVDEILSNQRYQRYLDKNNIGQNNNNINR